MAHIFISYAHEDEGRIHPLVRALEQQRWSVFWDRRIPTGQTWRSYIGKALSDASCVLVVWSRYSIASGWVSEEAEEGKQRNILVPVLLDAVEPPIGFRSIQAADLTDWRPERSSVRFDQLIYDIRGVLSATPTPLAVEHLAEPASQIPRPQYAVSQGTPPASRRRITYGALLAVLVVLVVGGGYWVYQAQFSHTSSVSSRQDAEKPETRKYQLYLHLGKPSYRYLPAREDILQALAGAGLAAQGIDTDVDPYGPGVDFFHDKDRESAERVVQILNALLPKQSKQFTARKQTGKNQEGTLGIWF
jgi:TIR domain-containing protein